MQCFTHTFKALKALLLASVTLLVSLGAVLRAEDLPKALILGDTLYSGLSGLVTNELKGRVQVVYKHPGSTSAALAQLDQLLGQDKWAVIHFNFGLADLHYRDPGTTSVRLMSKEAGGVLVTPPDQYGKNLQEIVKRLKATGAKLIWANTAPIKTSGPLYDAGSEVAYNEIAARIMTTNGVAINDMNSFATALAATTRGDPSPFYSKIPLQPLIIRSILRALNLKSEPKDWPAAPAKHIVKVRRDGRDATQTAMIAAAEAGPKVWWSQEQLGVRVPTAITADAVTYYSDLVGNYGKQVLKSSAEPFSQLDYHAGIQLHKEFKLGEKTFANVHVVTLKLTFDQYFAATPADGMHFQKERVVVLDATGKVLSILGDGPTEVSIIAI